MRPRSLSLTDHPAIAVFLVSSSLAVTGCDPENPTSSTSSSNPSFKRDSARTAAVVIRDTGCALFDGAGQTVLADRDITILTQSRWEHDEMVGNGLDVG